MNPRIFSVLLLSWLAPAVTAEAPIGFRTDGTGRYPNAQPPIEWGAEKNVIWKVPLTQSNAIPVILGNKVFTCAEPCVVLCIDKTDGKILWKGESSYKELVLTAKEQQILDLETIRDKALSAEQAVPEKQMSDLRKKLKDGDGTKEEIEPKLEKLKKEVDAIRQKRNELTTLNRYKEPGKNAGGFHPTGGYSSPTPVTDGKHVYAMFGNGLVACYDVAGERRWMKLVEHPTVSYGHGASPVLVNDKLLVHFEDLVALDVKDGSEVWRRKIAPSHGTAMPTRIGDVEVVVHPNGQVIRVTDGAIVADKLGSCGPNSPLVQEGKVFFVAGQARGYTIPTSMESVAKWEPLWKGVNLKGGGYWFPSPILHDGLIYAMNASSIFTVVDAKTGERVYEQRLEFGGGQSYPSITLAGKYLYVSSDNGATIVLEPGREYKEVGRNALETFRSSLVFEGKRMYARTTKHLWCIGE